ncbi:MAG: EVE domain-containing protein [Chitinophagaceae bacterium]|nr:EVE domain-containing protein [Chitinophagaceae bacterium]
MKYWLVKSDPETYGWDHLVKDKKTDWSGVRNYAARIHLKAMKKGDVVLFYHSQQSQAIVGLAKVTKQFFQDPTTTDDAWVAVEIAVLKPLKNPVTLADIKAIKELKEFPLVRISRLSVMPVSDVEFERILKMSGTSI